MKQFDIIRNKKYDLKRLLKLEAGIFAENEVITVCPEPPARGIVERPELRLYYDGFGNSPADHCLAAETDGHVVGAVWTRIMKDYEKK